MTTDKVDSVTVEVPMKLIQEWYVHATPKTVSQVLRSKEIRKQLADGLAQEIAAILAMK